MSFQVSFHLFRSIIFLQGAAVLVGIVECVADNQSTVSSHAEVRGHAGCVLWYENVGHYTSSSVYRTAQAGVIYFSFILLDAVGREEFAVFITSEQIEFVFRFLTFFVRFLYAASGWGVVACDGQTDGRAVAEFNGLLYQTFSERTASYDGTAVIVLDGSGKDFAGRSRTFVHQYHKRHLLVASCSVGVVVFARRLASLGVDNQTVVWQELVDHLDGSSHVTSRISTQVDNQAFTVLLIQFGQCDKQFRISGFTKLVDFYVAYLFINHIGGIDTLHWNVSTDNSEMKQVLFARTVNTQFHLAAFFTFQTFHGFTVCHNLTDKSRIIYFHNTVACHQTHFFRGTALNDAVYMNGIVLNGKLDTDTAETTFQIGVYSFQVLGRNIRRMRVEFRKNLRHGFFHQFAHVYRIYILVVDDAQQRIQLVG